MPLSFDIDRPITDERVQRRVAQNQATLRTLNEAMRVTAGDEPIAFRCECGQLGCNQLIELRRSQYEAVRRHARRFAVVPGHEVDEVEDVIERHGRYAVVEARVAAAIGVAERTSPRHPRATAGP